MQHSLSSRLLGLAFILYSLGCLALVWFLIYSPPPQEEKLYPPPLPSFTITPEPRLGHTQLPDMNAIGHIPERKQVFIELLLPMIEERNRFLEGLRGELEMMRAQLQAGRPLTRVQKRRLEQLRIRYRLPQDEPGTLATIERLLRRADQLPVSMVLAQAAAESGWGTSRFAVEANNLFGQWCFSPGCGLVPERRPEGARHEVQRFESLEAALQSYYRNLNTHAAYRNFRSQRAALRAEGRPLSGYELVGELLHYSSRGQDYIDELRSLISYNNFDLFDAPDTGAQDELLELSGD